MATAFTADTVIVRPIDETWAILTRWETAHHWQRGLSSIRALGDTQAGTELRFHARGKEHTATIVAADAPNTLTLRAVSGGVTALYTYRLEPIDDARTRASLTVECETRGVLLWWFRPVLRFLMRLADGKQIHALARYAESESASPEHQTEA